MTFYKYCQQDKVESMSEVTRESQKAHIEKIKATIEKITEYRNSNIGKFESIYLSADDLDVIERALACHYLDEESAKEPQECEWIYDGEGYYLHGNDWISGKSDFKFCPYCGKVIKVSGHLRKGRDDR